ncbi:MAG TPA: hypothetical protein VKX17_17810 [Planctomycetota bacterium]|nr:hypothetical protein [Planctomycetota bacterium]
MNRICSALLVLTFPLVGGEEPPEERLCFQTNGSWSPRLQLDSDVAIVYGIDKNLPARIESWRSKGYRIHVMTGVSWGHYQDYLEGRFDGTIHADEGQTGRDGKQIMHGGGIYYICPSESYGRFLCAGVQRALDSGAEAIHLEEPEFWVRAGYSESFKREWRDYYKEDWQPPHASVDAQYRASKLKYMLYQRTLSQVFRYVHDYNQQHGRAVRCYVPSHSLLNYAHWNIVSPESSLLGVGCDGFIAQVWTGTARTPNVYEGERKERTFETAFLEYSAMQNLVRASGKRVWYLNDPVEDNPRRSWSDYRRNWENTLLASLLQPDVWRYETMPWPERIFNGKYPADDAALKQPEATRERVSISKAYESELQAVIRGLGEMKQPEQSVRWEICGTQGIGVLVSDTMMFQRGDPNPSDKALGSFYGLAMPLLKRGIPVQPVQLEFAGIPRYLEPYKILLLTYEGQKPPKPELHAHLADWVKRGGVLVVVDDDKDPYNAVREWWNADGMSFRTPRQQLFKLTNVPEDAVGWFAVEKGWVLRESLSPAALTYQKDGADKLRSFTRQAAEKIGLKWTETNALALRRGPYIIAAGLSESGPALDANHLDGRFVNLFDPELSVISRVDLQPDLRAMLVDLNAFPAGEPRILAGSCRTRNVRLSLGTFTFDADGIADSMGLVLIALPAAPTAVSVDGKELPKEQTAFSNGILRIRFSNTDISKKIEIQR